MSHWDKMSLTERERLINQAAQDPESQLMHSDEDGEGEELVEEISEAETPKKAVAGKRPYNPQIWPVLEEDEDEEIVEHDRKYKRDFARNLRCLEYLEVPDLGAYLAVFGLTEFQQISLCRTYANYLTQSMKAKKNKIKK